MTGAEVIAISAVHAEVLALLHQRAFEEGWSAESFRGLLDLPTTLGCLAVSSQGTPQGFVLCQVAGVDAEIVTLAVDPAQRRCGVGSLLLIGLCARLAAAKVAWLFLEAALDNEAALALYRSFGFAEVGRRKGYYARAAGAGADAAVMKASLDVVERRIAALRLSDAK